MPNQPHVFVGTRFVCLRRRDWWSKFKLTISPPYGKSILAAHKQPGREKQRGNREIENRQPGETGGDSERACFRLVGGDARKRIAGPPEVHERLVVAIVEEHARRVERRNTSDHGWDPKRACRTLRIHDHFA